jgi:hypothetical protein
MISSLPASARFHSDKTIALRGPARVGPIWALKRPHLRADSRRGRWQRASLGSKVLRARRHIPTIRNRFGCYFWPSFSRPRSPIWVRVMLGRITGFVEPCRPTRPPGHLPVRDRFMRSSTMGFVCWCADLADGDRYARRDWRVRLHKRRCRHLIFPERSVW